MNIQKLLKSKTFLLQDEIGIKHILGIVVEDGYLLINKEKAVLFTDARSFDYIKTLSTKIAVEHKLFSGLEDIKNELISQGVKKVYLDYDKVTLTDYKNFKRLGVKLLDGASNLKELRAVKDKEEIALIKKSCEIIYAAMSVALTHIKEGVTENYIKDIIVSECIKQGASGESFETIVAFNKNSAIPHHKTGDTKLERNNVILIDAGCVYNGYCSDITRTYFYGEPSKDFIETYNHVLKANELAIENIKVGCLERDADKISRNYLSSVGLGEYFSHSLGHGVGLEIHENIRLSPKGDKKLKKDSVFTIEPGVYKKNEYGVRIEDTVVLTKSGIKRFFKDDKKLVIIK